MLDLGDQLAALAGAVKLVIWPIIVWVLTGLLPHVIAWIGGI